MMFSTVKKKTIAELSVDAIKLVSSELGITTTFKKSSEHFSNSLVLKGSDRLIEICKATNSKTYINPIGGIELYDKEEFETEGLNLFFLKSKPIEYKQFNNEFVPGLSIIDVMMFNSKAEIREMLNQYELV
jgi:hypothetical protein